MTSDRKLRVLLEAGRTVFTLKDLEHLWGYPATYARLVAKRMADRELIFRITRGYYSLHRNFNEYELANVIIRPSYVSLHSALLFHGISFQVTTTVSSVAPIHYEKQVGKMQFVCFAMKDELLYNMEGIVYKGNIAMAEPERAILDSFYFGRLPNADNRDKLNITFLKNLVSYYPHSVREKLMRFIG